MFADIVKRTAMMESMKKRFELILEEEKNDEKSYVNLSPLHSLRSGAETPQENAAKRWSRIRKAVRTPSSTTSRPNLKDFSFDTSSSDLLAPNPSSETEGVPMSSPIRENEILMEFWQNEELPQLRIQEFQTDFVNPSELQVRDAFNGAAEPVSLVVSRIPEEVIHQQRLQAEELISHEKEKHQNIIKNKEYELILLENNAKERLYNEKEKLIDSIIRRERSIGREFRRAREILEASIRRQSAVVREKYGEQITHHEHVSRKFQVHSTITPQPIEMRIHILRAIKTKLPKGAYVLLLTQFDSLGGKPLSWSKIGLYGIGPDMPAVTHPAKHYGRFFDRALKVESSCFALCPPKSSLKPGFVLVLELFQLANNLNPSDRVVAWGAIPMCDEHLSVIKGKFKIPLLRGEHSPAIQLFRKMEQAMSLDLNNWLCNIYFEIKHLPLSVLEGIDDTMGSTSLSVDFLHKHVTAHDKIAEERNPEEVPMLETEAKIDKGLFQRKHRTKPTSNKGSKRKETNAANRSSHLSDLDDSDDDHQNHFFFWGGKGQSKICDVNYDSAGENKYRKRDHGHHVKTTLMDRFGKLVGITPPLRQKSYDVSNNVYVVNSNAEPMHLQHAREKSAVNFIQNSNDEIELIKVNKDDDRDKKQDNDQARNPKQYPLSQQQNDKRSRYFNLGLKQSKRLSGLMKGDDSIDDGVTESKNNDDRQAVVNPIVDLEQGSKTDHGVEEEKISVEVGKNVMSKTADVDFDEDELDSSGSEIGQEHNTVERGYESQDEDYLHEEQRGKLVGVESINSASGRYWAKTSLNEKPVARRWQSDGARFDNEAIPTHDTLLSTQPAKLKKKLSFAGDISGSDDEAKTPKSRTDAEFLRKSQRMDSSALSKRKPHLGLDSELSGISVYAPTSPKSSLRERLNMKWQPLENFEEMESYTPAIAADPSMRKRLMPGAITKSKLQYLYLETFGDLVPYAVGTFDFYVTVVVYLAAFWLRIYFHFMGQYLFLQSLGTPVFGFSLQPLFIRFKYLSNSITVANEVGVVITGPISNIIVFICFILFARGFYKFTGNLPDALSKFNVAFGLFLILNPYLIMAIGYYGDFSKLWYRMERVEGSGLTGLLITVFLYLGVTVLACLLMYEYLVHIHRNGHVIDVYQRINSQAEEFFLPDDFEISLEELKSICTRASRWRGANGHTRKVVVSQYIEHDPYDPTFEEITKHYAIYELSADHKKSIYRHFLMLPDGAIVEIFDQFSSGLSTKHSALQALLKLDANENVASNVSKMKVDDGRSVSNLHNGRDKSKSVLIDPASGAVDEDGQVTTSAKLKAGGIFAGLDNA